MFYFHGLFDLASVNIYDNPLPTPRGGNPIPSGAKIKNLSLASDSIHSSSIMRISYLNIRYIVPLHSCNTPSVVELDLPHTAQIRKKILDALARPYVPHLKGTIRS